MARDVMGVVAVGLNCTDPDEVSTLLPATAAARRPVLVYPNSGEQWDGAAQRWTGDPTWRPEQVEGWLEAGVAAVGGCCQISPEAISAVAGQVRRHAA